MNPTRIPTFLSVTDFLLELPIGRTLLYDQIRQGRIYAVKIGARTMIPSAELQRLVAPPAASPGDRGDRDA